MIDGIIGRMLKLSGQRPAPFEWVAISVEEVCGDTDGIRVKGRAAPFDHGRV